MGVLGHSAPIVILGQLPPVARRIARSVVAYNQHDLVRHELLAQKIERKPFRHLPQDQLGLFKRVGILQDLPGPGAAGLGLIGFDISQRAGLIAPGVVNQKLRVHAEQTVQHRLICQRTACNIPHGVKSPVLQLLSVAPSDAPEIGQRFMVPEQEAVTAFIQLGDTHTILVRLDMLGHNIHCDFTQIEVRPHSCGGRDAGGLKHIQNKLFRQLLSGEMVQIQIVGNIQKYFVDAVRVDVLRRKILQVHAVNPCAILNIKRHPGRSHNIIQLQRRVALQLGIVKGGSGERPARCMEPPLGVHLPDTLNHLEQTCPA